MPLKLRLTGSPNGKPDLQLQLFTLHFGEAAGQSPGQAGRRRQSPHLSGPGASFAPRCCSYLLGSASVQATSTESSRKRDRQQLGHGHHCFAACADAAKALESAAALLFLQLVFPDSVPAVVRRLAWIGAVSSGAQAAASAAPQRYRDRLERSLRHNGAQAMRILESRRYLGSGGVKGQISQCPWPAGHQCHTAALCTFRQ